MKLQNKTILITGASSGIGKAMALKAAKDGATVVLAARSADKLQDVATQVRGFGGTPIIVPTDVTSIDDIRKLFSVATENGRVLDVVFDNAGLGFIGKIWELPAQQIQSILAVNTTGMILVAKFATEIMQRQKYGHLIMTSSLAGLITLPEWSVYVASKWAITGFADSIRYELEPEGVLVTTLHPGMVSTDFFAKDKANQDMSKLDPNALSADQVANAVYDALFTKKRKIVIPAMSKSFAFLQKYAPALKDSLLKSMSGAVEYNKTTPEEDEPSFSYVKEV